MGMVAAQRFDLEIRLAWPMWVLAYMEVRRDHHHSFQPQSWIMTSTAPRRPHKTGPVVITDRGKPSMC